MTFYDHKVPDELVTHTLAICGNRGSAWLEDLPQHIADLEHKWSIQVLEPFPAIEFNFVAPAIKMNGEQVVIKIAPPFDNGEARGEAKYLRTLNGDGAVRLLAEDRVLEAILLERAVPGKNLAEIFTDDESSCLAHAIEVLKRIIRPTPMDDTDVLSLDDWFDGLRRFDATEFPSNYSEKALKLYDSELRRQQNNYLHGDFHPANIVSATRAPFLAIDPKGMIGPIGYEIAVFLNNFHWWQEGRPNVSDRLNGAIQTFSEAFHLNEEVLRKWAYAQMVLSAWWTFDEMYELYDNEVAKADVWNI